MANLQNNFIVPGVDLNKNDSDLQAVIAFDKESLKKRWQSPHGQKIIKQWENSGFERKILDTLVGKYYGHIDLRGIPLTNKILVSKDLSAIDFFSANLEGSDFSKSKLTDSWLSETNIKAANFDWAVMDSCLLDNVIFDRKTSFVGVNLSNINFTLAALLQDLAINQQRIKNLEETQPRLALFLKLSCDYGRSFSRFFFWASTVIMVFAVLYVLIPNSISTQNNFVDGLYFSFVTFTTLGFGDITPVSVLAKLLVVVEVFIGYIMLGLLVAIISKRIIPN